MTAHPRLAFLTPAWPGQATPNGIATAVYNLAVGLRQIGQPPVILAARIDGTGPADIPVIEVPVLQKTLRERLSARLGDREASHRHMARQIATAVDEAVTRHGAGAVLMEETQGWTRLVEMRCKVPVFLVLHGPNAVFRSAAGWAPSEDDFAREAREAKAFAQATAIIAPSRNVLEGVEEVVDLGDTPRIVLPNTFALDEAARSPRTRIPTDILFVGRFDAHKGGDVVMQAFDRLIETHPDARLTFVGPDRGVKRPDGSSLSFEDAYAAMAEKAQAGLSYVGQADRDQVREYRQTHGIALIASRYENLNYTLLEAMGAGQAIVCTAVGGPADILEDGKTALLVPPGDPDAMARALARLLEDHDLRQRLAQAASATIEADFNPAKVAAETVEFVESVLDL